MTTFGEIIHKNTNEISPKKQDVDNISTIINFKDVIDKLQNNQRADISILSYKLEQIGKSLNDKNSTEVKAILLILSKAKNFYEINKYILKLEIIASKYKKQTDDIKRIAREKQEKEFEKNLNKKIEDIKNIDLDFKVEYKSWKDFKKDIYEKSGYKSFSIEEKKEFDLLLDTQIKPILESYSKIFDNINISDIGEGLDDLLDKVNNSNESKNGKIIIDLPSSGLTGDVKDYLKNLYNGSLDFIVGSASDLAGLNLEGFAKGYKIENQKIIFSSKEEAIQVIGNLKQGLNSVQAFYDKAFDSFTSVINSVFNNSVGFGLKKAGEAIYNFEKLYLQALQKDLEITIGNGLGFAIFMLTANGLAVMALNRSLDSALSGVDYGVFTEAKKSVEDLVKIYKEAGLEKEVESIESLYENIRNLHPEDGDGKMLDNYKKLGELYRELQSWRGTGVGDGIRFITSYIGDFADNGRVLNTENLKIWKWGKDFSMPLKFAKDVLILPYKLGFIYLNKGPKGGFFGWKLRNKGLIVQDYVNEIKKSTQKFSRLFDIVDNLEKILGDKISNEDIKNLKKDILSEYKSKLLTSKLDPLKENRLELEGKTKIKKVNIDEIVSQKIESFLQEKFGSKIELQEELKDLLSELKNNSDEFKKNREVISTEKEKFSKFIKYYPEISDAIEDKLLKHLDLLESISISKNDFSNKVFIELLEGLNQEDINKFLLEIKSGGGAIETKNTKKHQKELFNILDNLKGKGVLSKEEYSIRKNNIKDFFITNKTLWLPHYIEILDSLIEGKSIDIGYENIDITKNDIDTFFSEKKKEIGIIKEKEITKPESKEKQNSQETIKISPEIKEKIIEKYNYFIKKINLSSTIDELYDMNKEVRIFSKSIQRAYKKEVSEVVLNYLESFKKKIIEIEKKEVSEIEGKEIIDEKIKKFSNLYDKAILQASLSDNIELAEELLAEKNIKLKSLDLIKLEGLETTLSSRVGGKKLFSISYLNKQLENYLGVENSEIELNKIIKVSDIREKVELSKLSELTIEEKEKDLKQREEKLKRIRRIK